MTQTVQLIEMTGTDLAEFVEHSEVTYAQDMHRNGGLTLEQAQAKARASTQELFPDGQPAPGNHLWRALDPAGEPVGVLWLAHRDPGTPGEHAWIYDIEVLAERRGQGWGRALMVAAEGVTRDWGVSSLQLNVFGGNEIARNLYRSQGFTERSVQMGKHLG